MTNEVEIVERKGIGHPDTICDALAETLSRNLCQEYQRRFGEILHHNVDKALLCGGRAVATFGGGSIIAPFNIYLAGRAIAEVGGEAVPIKEIAVEGSRAWLKANLHALDPERQVRVDALVQHTSQDLQTLFSRRDLRGIALANDTSFGVGYAPLTPLERLVLAIEKRINGRDRERAMPAWGEDIKVMAVRSADKVEITVACAMIGRFLANMDEYLEQKVLLEKLVRKLADEHGFTARDVGVNTADSVSSGSIYLTVTGTSAEAGDDGQVGRGNRVNGLITPCRPMSLEAAAGKNPVSHVGKIYNVLARDIAEAIVAAIPEIESAQCLMVSRIGAPVTLPALVQIKIATREAVRIADLRKPVDAIVGDRIARIPELVSGFVAGSISVF
ncbi:methionine adenosyltransferase [Bradyrhizobium sp.]|uniref:methionine adenosyltransferase n=1 Tax=Bradyrhizobium sp. TaxID=376 RepID=UPI003C710991